MPTWLAILIGAVVLVMIVFAIGGILLAGRRQREGKDEFDRHVTETDRALAAAHAADKGWDPAVVEAAAREAFAAERGGAEPREVTLVAVVDKPGTDADKAVFRVATDAAETALLTLGRQDGQWVLDSLE